MHVFDLSVDERAPIPVGAFFASDARAAEEPAPGELPACTSHEGNFSSDGKLLTLGWYANGPRVFDVSAITQSDLPPGAPVGGLVTEVGFARMNPVSDAWVAKTVPTVPGYLFVNDTGRGLDIFHIDI